MDVVNEKAAKKILPYVKSIENGTIKGPISLHLLITDFCVNKCNMCGHWKTKCKKSLSLDVIKNIWSEMNENDCESVCLTGGDPILHPNFEEILDLKRNFDLGVICTGNFNPKFDFEKLSKLKWLRFSIDSLNLDRYMEIRGLSNLYSVIIPNLIKAKNYIDQVGINFTIQKKNIMDVRDIVKFAYNEEIYRLMIYPMHGDSDLCLNSEDIKVVLEQLREVIKYGFHKEIPENNIVFLYQSLKAALEKDTEVRKAVFDYSKYPCIINKIHLSVGSDGNVFPCEMIADDTDAYGERDFWDTHSHYNSLGNVNEESLMKIWKNNFDNSFCSGKCENCFSRYLPINKAYYENIGKRIFI
ncbi:MAG: Radical domain protein [Sedimentibacter sp.]|jgi:MoaA/NifB/PqqE/SkfB family radical SAM enzyme|nr:Radical domain protein [Sedimentibacter sp.]